MDVTREGWGWAGEEGARLFGNIMACQPLSWEWLANPTESNIKVMNLIYHCMLCLNDPNTITPILIRVMPSAYLFESCYFVNAIAVEASKIIFFF